MSVYFYLVHREHTVETLWISPSTLRCVLHWCVTVHFLVHFLALRIFRKSLKTHYQTNSFLNKEKHMAHYKKHFTKNICCYFSLYNVNFVYWFSCKKPHKITEKDYLKEKQGKVILQQKYFTVYLCPFFYRIFLQFQPLRIDWIVRSWKFGH